jgi:hypothetical protein
MYNPLAVQVPRKEQQIAEAEISIAQIDAILNVLAPSQSDFVPSLETCRKALERLTLLLTEGGQGPGSLSSDVFVNPS